MKYLQADIKEQLYKILKDDFDFLIQDILFTIPPDRKFGDLSTTLPFILAKKTKEKPFLLGNKIIEKITGKFPMFSDVKLAGGGFINFYFDHASFFNYMLENKDRAMETQSPKVIVEHTSINPNKSAHIGHLRNACLGDTLAKALRFLGYTVEVQNYLDDTGIQVADVVWGLLYHEQKTIEDIKKIDNLPSYLWKLYSQVNRMYESDDSIKQARNEVHRKIEDKIEPEYGIGNYLSQEVLRDHIGIMDILGIRYDLLIRESDIIELGFFKEAAEALTANNIMYDSKDPKKEGCKVIKYHKENLEKIVVRSNNTVTYIGKDIAYAMWKAGLFSRDFYYREFYSYPQGKGDIFISHDKEGEDKDYGFGKGQIVYNVIGIRQAYLQNIIAQEVIAPLSGEDNKRESIHFSYEMVSLTPRCVAELGFELSEEDKKKSHVDVSGRKGIAVKADELIEILIGKSLQEVKLRNTEMEEKKALAIATDIAVGALRYFMIKFNATSMIAFDFKDALAFEGDTGPYLQYTVVRINSILKKLGEMAVFSKPGELNPEILKEKEFAIFYDIILFLSLLELQVELAVANRDISGIANYSYSLCQKINHYYHLFPIISEKDRDLSSIRLTLILLVKKKLEKLFEIMGMPIPEKM